MSNFESVKKFMLKFGQEVKENADFPSEKITKLRYDLISEELGELKSAIGKKDLKEIAELKMNDLNANSIEMAIEMIRGTARSMGLEVEK